MMHVWKKPLPDLLQSPKVTKGTAKIFLFDQNPNDPKFPFVVERESLFWRKKKDGTIEQCVKRKGKGFPGGGVEDDETQTPFIKSLEERGINLKMALERVKPELRDEFLAAVREGEEELGVPGEELITRIDPNLTYIRYSGSEMHPWVLFYADGSEIMEKQLIRRDAIQDEKLISLLQWNKVGWARFFDKGLQKTILAPFKKEDREKREETGDVWFYTGHLVALLHMLLILKREDLFRITLSQISSSTLGTRPIMELLMQTKQEQVLIWRWQSPKFYLNKKFAYRLVRHLIALDRASYASVLIDHVDKDWKDELARFVTEETEKKKFMPELYVRASEDEGVREEFEPAEAGSDEEVEIPEVPPPLNPLLEDMLKSAKR